MTGGGFGGCVVALMHTSAVEAIIQRLKSAFRARFGKDPSFFLSRAADGSRIRSNPNRF